MDSPELGALFLQRARYFLTTDYRTKLRCAVEALPPDRIWLRPNESSNIWIAKLHAPGSIVFHDDAGGLARPVWKSMTTPPRGAASLRPAAERFSREAEPRLH